MLDENKNTERKSSESSMTSPFNKSDGYRALFKNKDFIALWFGQIFSQLADRVIFVVFVAYIANSFGTSSTLQSWLYIAFTIPAVLFTAIAGVFVDRWNRKNIMITTNVLRAVIITLIPFIDGSLLGIYLLAFAVSSVTQFFIPAEASSIPFLVNKNQLLTANSLFTTTMMASLLFGFVLGDPLINIFGLQSVYIAISALFIISATSLSFINYKPKEVPELKTFKAFLEDLKEGFNYIINRRVVFQAMLKLAVLFSIIVMLSILAIGISQNYLYPKNAALGAQKFVYIVAFSGLGMIIGSIAVGKILRNIKKYTLIYTGFSIIGLSLVLMALVKFIPNELHLKFQGAQIGIVYLETFNFTFRMLYIYLMSFLTGLGCAMVAVPVQTILHTSINEKVRGKVFGFQFTLLSTSSTLPVLFAAFGADTIGVSEMLLIIGLPLLFFAFLNLSKKICKQKKN